MAVTLPELLRFLLIVGDVATWMQVVTVHHSYVGACLS